MSMEIMRFCKLYMRSGIELPIRPSEMSVLNIVCAMPGPHTPVSLAKALCVSRPMIAAHLNVLVSRGFISRVRSPEDGRSVYIMPTKRGMTLMDKYNSVHQSVLDRLQNKMGRKKYDTFIGLICLANSVLGDVQDEV